MLWLHICSQLLLGSSSCLLRHLWLTSDTLAVLCCPLLVSPTDTLQTMDLNSPVLHLPGFIVLTCTHTFSKSSIIHVPGFLKLDQRLSKQLPRKRFLPTVPENEKCSRLSLTAFSFKYDFSILSSPQASKKWCINMNNKEISKLCQ